jgi:hypothetical protein
LSAPLVFLPEKWYSFFSFSQTGFFLNKEWVSPLFCFYI